MLEDYTTFTLIDVLRKRLRQAGSYKHHKALFDDLVAVIECEQKGQHYMENPPKDEGVQSCL